jgi:hypothetical protein
MRYVRFKFRCNVIITGKIIKEMPGSVASGTPCIIPDNITYLCSDCISISSMILYGLVNTTGMTLLKGYTHVVQSPSDRKDITL